MMFTGTHSNMNAEENALYLKATDVLAPKFKEGFDRPATDNDFKEHIAKTKLNIQNIITELSKFSIRGKITNKRFIPPIILFIAENHKKFPWNDDDILKQTSILEERLFTDKKDGSVSITSAKNYLYLQGVHTPQGVFMFFEVCASHDMLLMACDVSLVSFLKFLTERAKSPIRRDREFCLSSDVCLSVSQSGLEVTVFKRF